jgi:CHAT domain-containing protein
LIHAQEKASLGSRRWQNNPEWSWRFRILKAQVLVWRGLSKDSLNEIKNVPPSQLSVDVAVRWRTTQALAYCLLRQYDEADRLLREAHRLSVSDRSDLLAEVLAGQGLAALFRGQYETAETLLGEATNTARQSHNLFIEASSLGNLGLASLRRGRYGEAIDWYQAALIPSRALGNSTSIEKATGSLGWCYFKMGDFEKALSLTAEAERIAAEMGVLKDQQIWLSNIGLIYLKQKDYIQAQSYYAQSLVVAERLDSKPAAAIVLTNLALSEIQSHEFRRAEEHNSRALEMKRSLHDRPSELYSIFNQAQIEVAQGKFSEAKRHFDEVITESQDASLRWEAQVELAKLYLVDKENATAEAEFRKALATIDNARSALSKEEYRLSFLNTAAEFYHDYIDLLVSRGRFDDALAVAEHSRARTLSEGLGIKPAALGASTSRPTTIARQQNAVVLAYWLKPGRSYLWVITPNKVALFPIAADSEIDDAVQAYRRAVTGPRDPLETANDSGRRLFEMLVAPAQKLIPAKSGVIIIADGSLHGLNFETLLAPTPKLHYWIEDVTISNANSLAMLGASRARAPNSTQPNLLLIGNPVSASSEFPALAQAKDEIRDVASHFGDDRETIIDGAKATPAAYLASDPGKFSHIHFVAHGTASRLSPLDSAVVLSPQGDSYKLYARDIVDKPLRADLVTISACYGSGSRAYSGEGLVGLSWAFLRAGAHNVVAALWEANDISTPKLMDAMYRGIRSGDDPATALREAKLAMLHSDNVFRRPFYWAPFQLYVGSGFKTKPGLPKQNVLARAAGS